MDTVNSCKKKKKKDFSMVVYLCLFSRLHKILEMLFLCHFISVIAEFLSEMGYSRRKNVGQD